MIKKNYYVRVSFDYEFVKNHLGDNIFPSSVMAQYLPSKNNIETLFSRFTFTVFRAKSENETLCRKVFEDAFLQAFPGESYGIKTLIFPDDNSEKSKLIYTMYTAYYGVDEYQDLITSISGYIPYLENRGALRALRKQSYLFALDKGCGFTTLTSSFADFLIRMGAFDDYSDDKRTDYSEFKIGPETKGNIISVDDVLEDLYERKTDASDAVIGLDISYFLDGEKFEELRDFAQRLYPLQDCFVFMFRIPFIELKALERVHDALSDIMLIKVVSIPPLHDSVLLEFFYDTCGKLGYKVSSEVYDIFFEKISLEKKDGRFYGFKTCEKIAEEIVLHKASHDDKASRAEEKTDTDLICESDLSGYIETKREKQNGYAQLSELIGMENITAKIKEIVAQVKVSLANEKLDRPCIHMRFLGSPGTGKTTVARIIGQIFREEGILRKGAFLEYSARALCAEYIGQTAVKTASICRDAYGSVLFLDEAYALYTGDSNTNDYGKEALTTLISEMENHRDDMLVIMAGYTDDMENLMKGNSGLRSRMPYILTFENYTRKQLFDIFMLMVKKHFEYTEDLEMAAKDYFDSLSDEYISSKEFANARFVRNLYERTWSKGALRSSLDGKTNVVLNKSDFVSASSEKEFSEKLEQKKTLIGFY